MSEAVNFLTPVARIVLGHPLVGQNKDAEGNALVFKTGPNTGQPRLNYFMALAIPKTDPGYPELWAKIHGAAKTGFPTLFDAAGNCTNPAFAFKVVDGDSTVANTKGKTPASREGFPGHYVLYFNGLVPKVYNRGGVAETIDPASLKTGDYVRVAGSVVGNEAMNQPGVYLNARAVEIIGYGDEIVSGVDAAAVFGGTPAGALPAGASATPVAAAPSAAMASPVAPGAATPPPPVAAPAPMAPLPAPAPAAAPPPAPAAPAPVQPAPDILTPPAGATAHVMTAAATYTYEQYIAAGWDDARLIAEGLMIS